MTANYKRKKITQTEKTLILSCLALNEKFGFGERRLKEFLQRVGDICDDEKKDEEFWTHAVKRLSQLGLNFN